MSVAILAMGQDMFTNKKDYTNFNLKAYVWLLLLIALIGLFIGGVIVYKVFPYKVINEDRFYRLVILDSGFADFFHSIFPIPVENKVRFKKDNSERQDKLDAIADYYGTGYLPILITPRGARILEDHEIDHYDIDDIVMVNLYEENMTLHEWYEFEMNPRYLIGRVHEYTEMDHYRDNSRIANSNIRMITEEESYEEGIKTNGPFIRIDNDDDE